MLKSDGTQRQHQIEHLAQVRALLDAIASAISAVEKNDLRKFEVHLAVQETICNRLSAKKWTMWSGAAPGDDAAGENTDANLWEEIRQAHIALAHLNRVYAALLKRARKSVELMSALYISHVPLPRRHTWSCEV
jgi:hypothetical protein